MVFGLYASSVCPLPKVMAAHLDVPCTEQSYEDAFFAFGSRAHVGSDFEVP